MLCTERPRPQNRSRETTGRGGVMADCSKARTLNLETPLALPSGQGARRQENVHGTTAPGSKCRSSRSNHTTSLLTRRRRRQREWGYPSRFHIEPPSTIARRAGPVRSHPHTKCPAAAQPRTAARCLRSRLSPRESIKSQRPLGGGDLLGATKKLELPGSCQLKGRPSQTNPEERTTVGRDAPSFLPSSSRVFALSWGWRFPCFGVCPSRLPSPAVSTSETRRKMGWRFIRPMVKREKSARETLIYVRVNLMSSSHDPGVCHRRCRRRHVVLGSGNQRPPHGLRHLMQATRNSQTRVHLVSFVLDASPSLDWYFRCLAGRSRRSLRPGRHSAQPRLGVLVLSPDVGLGAGPHSGAEI